MGIADAFKNYFADNTVFGRMITKHEGIVDATRNTTINAMKMTISVFESAGEAMAQESVNEKNPSAPSIFSVALGGTVGESSNYKINKKSIIPESLSYAMSETEKSRKASIFKNNKSSASIFNK